MATLNDTPNDDLERVIRRLIEFSEEHAAGEGPYDSVTAEVGRQLRIICDELNSKERETMGLIVSGLVAPASENQYFTTLLRNFTVLVSNKARISAESVKSLVRIFVQLWSNKELGKEIANVIKDEVSPAVSVELSNTNDEFTELYYKCLCHGSQLVKDIRVMIVGMFGVGKTSLLNNLISVEDDTTEHVTKTTTRPESTVGIDVTNCEVLEDGRWMKTYDTNIADGKLTNTLVQLKYGKEKPDDKLREIVRQLSIENQNGQQTEPAKVPNLAEFKRTKEDSTALDKLMHMVEEIMSNPKAHEDIRVSIWDFAGQNIYYSTHHFFLNHRSIYLLLMDVSKPLNASNKEMGDFPISGFSDQDFTCLEVFKFWLRSIYMYHSTRISKISIKPCVVLVGTHKDELKGSEDDKEKQKEDFFNEALSSFDKSPLLQLVHRKKFLINNLDTKEDYQSIREEIINIAKDQDYWNEPRPAKWIPLERSLENIKAEGKEVISFNDLKTADEQNDLPIGNEKDLKSFLKLQDLLGNVLYYDTEILHNCIILSPQWIIDAFRCFISHMPDKDPKTLHLWKIYEEQGILTHELIDEIIDKNPKNDIFKCYKTEIIEYMERLDMIAQPVEVNNFDQPDEASTPGTRDLLSESQASNLHLPPKFYIVPIMLRSQLNEENLQKWLNPPNAESKTPVLAYVFKDGFLPPSIFHRLLAICIRKWPVRKIGGKQILFNGLAAFSLTKSSTLTIWYQDNIVYGRVCCYGKCADIKQICAEARCFLSNSLRSILNILPNKAVFRDVVPFDEYIQCTQLASFEAGKALIRLRDFLFNDEILCEECPDEHCINKTDGLAPWCNDLLEQCQSGLSPDVLTRSPTPTEFVKMALKCIGNDLRMFTCFGVNSKRQEQLREDYRHHTATFIYHCFLEAKRNMEAEKESSYEELTVDMIRKELVWFGGDVARFDELFMETDSSRKDSTDSTANPSEMVMDLDKLTGSIGREYWLLGILIGISENTMQQLRQQYHDTRDVIKSMLKEWKSKNENASVTVLHEAMQMVNSDCEYIRSFHGCKFSFSS